MIARDIRSNGISHAPFAEDAARFNRELAEFVRQIQV
jgi:hypothetical protein